MLYDYHSNSISVVSQAETIPDIEKEYGLGMIDYLAVTDALATSSKAKTRKTTSNHLLNKDRFTIGKYSIENGHATTANQLPSLEELTKEASQEHL